ncbi:hypothetical protein QQ045_019450 [Rhodiola kirilowii]
MGDLLSLQLFSQNDHTGKTLSIKVAYKEGCSVCVIAGSVVFLTIASLDLAVILLRINRKETAKDDLNGSLVAFVYRELQNATKNFSDRLGGGGFGLVFRGTFTDSTTVAVKKLESVNQGEKQFRAEVSTIGTVQHVKLVRLHGFCSEGLKKLLVYEYMPNGSLDAHLFNGKAVGLDWSSRYRTALGTAIGLSYLHENCRDRIIHCDIKPENILLNPDFSPKVADFGLAKVMGQEFSRVLTTIRGTRGYLALEWISGVAITAKADVYSYGMVLFELISGRRNSEQHDFEQIKFFPLLASLKIVNGDEDKEGILSLLDRRLEGNADVNEMKKMIKVACWCIQDEEEQRPAMGQVVQMLNGLVDVNLPVVPRSLMLLADSGEKVVFFTESSS